jgi:ketosteroid isomerase-like protein
MRTESLTTQQRVHDLIAYVRQGRILDAIAEFYADEVTMQENANAPTVGKAANLERERGFVDFVREWHEARALSVLVTGNEAAINWRLDYTAADGKRYRYDQIAHQVWRDGRIVSERFYYDPTSQLVAA